MTHLRKRFRITFAPESVFIIDPRNLSALLRPTGNRQYGVVLRRMGQNHNGILMSAKAACLDSPGPVPDPFQQ